MSPVTFSPDSQPYQRKGPSPVAVVALWAFVAMAVITMTALGMSVKSGNVDLIDRVIWDAGWICWAPLTYVVLAICRRQPIDRQRKIFSVVRLAVYGIGVVLLQM